jgi:urease accessory protein
MTTTTESCSPLAALHMMWLASPALPVGGFSYSEGLEAAVEAGIVSGEAQALDWLGAQLRLSQTRGELAAACAAHPAWARRDVAALGAIQQWVLATRETAELALQTRQMGRSMLDWVRGVHPDHPALRAAAQLGQPPTWPLAFALAAHVLELDAAQTAQAMAFSWLENQVQAAMRVVPLGQRAGQRLLAGLTPSIPAAVADALAVADDRGSWQNFSPRLAILSARHETQYSRLFRS